MKEVKTIILASCLLAFGLNANAQITQTWTPTYSVCPLTSTANPPSITITANPPILYQGQTVTLTASGADSIYHWYNGAVNNTLAIPTSTETNIWFAFDFFNHGGCHTSGTGTIAVFSNPTICKVSTDSASNYNYNTVYWDNAQYTRADSFFVYRYDLAQNNYLKLGAVSHNIGQFTDTARYKGSSFGTNGDPNYSSYKYKIALKDTLGYTSGLSYYHLTEFLQNQFNGNFNVSAYDIESGQTNPVTGYALMRDNNNTGNYIQITTISNGAISASDLQYSNFPNANYRVDIYGFNCNAANAKTTALIKAHSNTANKIAEPTGINELATNAAQVKIYPNPTNQTLNVEVESTNKNVPCSVYDVFGIEVINVAVNGSATLDVSGLKSGLYFVKVGNGVQMLVKE